MKNKFNIVPIKRIDVYQTVIKRIRTIIRDNNLSQGDRLPSERDLADSLQVSRSSIRQAIKALETLGEVEIRIGNGTYVCESRNEVLLNNLINDIDIDMTFLQNLAETRSAIECKIVELVVEKETYKDWVGIQILLEEAKQEPVDEEELGSLDLRFEKELAKVADNPLLTRLQMVIHDLWLTAWGELGIAPDKRISLHEEHLNIYKRIESGDLNQAVLLMRNHVDRKI